jgi:hypothetical protein
MSRNDVIMWIGRIATIVFTIAVLADMYTDQHLSREIRITVLSIVGVVVMSLFGWQVYIAQKYDGLPLIPFSFRWVVATWLGSLLVFIAWTVLITFIDDVYTDRRSAVVWWQFGTATLWFASRWVTVQTPHSAGVGETGASTTT